MSKSKPNLSYIDERLCFALYSTSKAVIAEYKPYLNKMDMTYPQYLVYITLAEHEILNVNELGQVLFLDSGTLTPLLKRMEANGLITRRRSDDDERQVYLQLTSKAMELKDDIAIMQENVSCNVGLEKHDFVKLRQQLKSINSNLRNLRD